MNANVESLWRELRTILRSRGELPFHHDVLTPAEIAETICRTSRDVRVHRFVREYYYPHRYGNGAGSMSDADAAALISSLRTQPEPARSDADEAPAESACGLCRRRAAR